MMHLEGSASVRPSRKLGGIPRGALIPIGVWALVPFLMGHGCDENKQKVCDSAVAQKLVLTVSGNCGQPGRIEVSASAKSCALQVSGDDVGLPRQGARINAPQTDLEQGGWNLAGELDGKHVRCPVTLKGANFEATCTADATTLCTAVLTPVK